MTLIRLRIGDCLRSRKISYEYPLKGNSLLTGDTNVSFLGYPEWYWSSKQAATALIQIVRVWFLQIRGQTHVANHLHP